MDRCDIRRLPPPARRREMTSCGETARVCCGRIGTAPWLDVPPAGPGRQGREFLDVGGNRVIP